MNSEIRTVCDLLVALITVAVTGAVVVAFLTCIFLHIHRERNSKTEDENNYLSVRINSELVPFCFWSVFLLSHPSRLIIVLCPM